MTTSPVAEEVHYPDGRVSLASDDEIGDSGYANGDLAPLPMLLNSHAGTKYGIPYPVFARASFGLRGANLPAILRALVACAWFGIQTWIGGEGIYTLVGSIV